MKSKTAMPSGVRAASVEAGGPGDLQRYWQVLGRRWKPAAAIVLATTAASAGLASLQKPSFNAAGKLLIRSNRLSVLTGLGGDVAASANNLGALSQLSPQTTPVRTEAENVLSRPVLEKTIEVLRLKDKKGKPVRPEDLMQKVKVKEVSGADVLKVVYDDPDPRKAAAVVNQVMQQYMKLNVSSNQSEAVAARQFIAQELPKTAGVVEQADAALRLFKERNQITDLAGEEKLLAQGLGNLEGEMTRVQTELTDVSSRYGSLNGKLGMNTQEAIAAGTLSQSTSVQQSLQQLQQIQAQLALERVKYQDNHPLVAGLVEKETALRQILQTRIGQTVGSQTVPDQSLNMGEIKQSLIKEYVGAEVVQLGLTQKYKTLANARAAYRSRLQRLPQLEQEQRTLQRRLDVAQNTYATLLKRLQEVQLAERQAIGTARLIESAAPPIKPSGSTKVLTVALGGILGLLLASATASFLEMRDRSIKTVKEARDLFGYTWLGTIPYFGKPPKRRQTNWTVPALPVRDMPRSLVSAAYRMIQANLRFLSLDRTLKTLVITSSVPKEGKSTVAANLAATMAQLGRRTLLIDADLHNPSQHHIWGISNVEGLSDVVVGQITAAQAAQPVLDNLSVLCAGSMPPNPLALLDSKRMLALIESLEDQYDCILLDAPPLVVEAEALTLGRITQGILLVTRPGVVDLESARTAKELLDQSNQPVLGMVINSAILEGDALRSNYYSAEPRVPAPAEAMAVR
jgi:polysaccharide biosynthesis transport protein